MLTVQATHTYWTEKTIFNKKLCQSQKEKIRAPYHFAFAVPRSSGDYQPQSVLSL